MKELKARIEEIISNLEDDQTRNEHRLETASKLGFKVECDNINSEMKYNVEDRRRWRDTLKSIKPDVDGEKSKNKKVGAMIKLEITANNDEYDESIVDELGKYLCMQIVAMKPKAISKNNLSKDFIESETKIIRNNLYLDDRLKNKPENVIDNIISGRVDKMIKSNCLLYQEYIVGGLTVMEFISEYSIKNRFGVEIKDFKRLEIGNE